MRKTFAILAVMFFTLSGIGQTSKINLVYFHSDNRGRVTKISAEAAMNRVKLSHLNYKTSGKKPMVLSNNLDGIILTISGDNDYEMDHLVKTHRFVHGGGRAVIFITTSAVEKASELLTDYFSVIPVRETIIKKSYIDNSSYLPYFGTGKVGVGGSGERKVYFSNVYFKTYNENVIEKQTITSSSSNKERIVSLRLKVGDGEVIIATGQNLYRSGGGGANSLFFEDKHFDLYDNEAITSKMIKYLIGN